MSTLVAEEGVAGPVAPRHPQRLVVVRRGRRRGGGWDDLAAYAVADALEAAGPDAVVLARGAEADPGAIALPGLARLLGHRVVRLPAHAAAAAWVVAVALHPDFTDDASARRLEALAGAPGAGGARLPHRRVGDDGPEVPVLRPGALARWAGCAWRACPRCSGGGPPGGRCGRCGAPGLAVTA